MNIKFRIDENWFKFYDDVKIDPIDQNFKLNFEQLKSSNLIHGKFLPFLKCKKKNTFFTYCFYRIKRFN